MSQNRSDESALRSAVLDAVARAYGLDPCAPRVFKGEFDRNIRITDPEQGTWLIKVSDEQTPAVALDWQETVLDAAARRSELGFHLAGHSASAIATPRCVRPGRASDGSRWSTAARPSASGSSSGSTGTCLSTRSAVPRSVYEQLGRTSAALTRAFADLHASR